MSDKFALFGKDLFGQPVHHAPGAVAGVLAARFVIPPFSVLDARSGAWQERKRAWLALGIKSEVGRGGNLIGHSKLTTIEKDTSIFDPVIAECAYSWWAPPGGHVLDPFAGGSVRGIVAATLGREYTGIDLRAEQVEANRVQSEAICTGRSPRWVIGDSLDVLRMAAAPDADFIFSCPPYGDLEVYSNDPHDLSTMTPAAFLVAYREIVRLSLARLKPDRFAAFVVGDYRRHDGTYANFPGESIAAFEAAGARLYNEAVMVTQAATVGLRVSGQFDANRKLGKTHQNLLVFVKGDPRRAAQCCAESGLTPPRDKK